MDAFRAPFALLAFLAMVVATPVFVHFLSAYGDGLQMEARFLAGLVPPFLALMLLASWLQPR